MCMPNTEKMNEALSEKRNAFFHDQLEQFQYDEVKNDVIDHSKTKAMIWCLVEQMLQILIPKQ